MLVKVRSVTSMGADIIEVGVEVNVFSRGFPTFDLVGLPSKEISESKHRVRAALVNSGFTLPPKKILINLTPANVPKSGSFYDLPIALGLLAGLKIIQIPSDSLFVGELSLNGEIRKSSGEFLALLHSIENRIEQVFIPKISTDGIPNINEVNLMFPRTLLEVIEYLKGERELEGVGNTKASESEVVNASTTVSKEYLINQIKGQTKAIDALEIAIAGGHNMILSGSPGSGKTMLAKSSKQLFPSLSSQEMLESIKLHSLRGEIDEQLLQGEPPFRSPHHSVSSAGMLGGGTHPKPGEISLAHNGVLFLDEVTEFSRFVLESLRGPLEDKEILVSRKSGSYMFPANFMLIATMNPCPCGNYGDSSRECQCTDSMITRYQKRLSSPIKDRFDLFVNMRRVEAKDLTALADDEGSRGRDADLIADKIISNVQLARALQQQRFDNDSSNNDKNDFEPRRQILNSEMEISHIKKFCSLDSDTERFLVNAADKLGMSARMYFKTLKLSRTIADLDQQEKIALKHVTKALSFRENA